jgi:hydrogenase expression/formation protein HypC
MCLAAPAQILSLEGADAVVDLDGRRRRASLLRGPEVAVGDWVLVAAGTVLRRIDPDEAIELDRTLRAAINLTEYATPPASPGEPR